MRNLRKFFRLCPFERRLLLRSLALLWISRLGLWLLPFRLLRRLLPRSTPVASAYPAKDAANIDRIVRALARAAPYVPDATCLTQAFAGQILLAQHGIPSLLRIGLAKNPEGKLRAHAWIESQGRILIGNSAELPYYAQLPPVERELP
jgi:hypothetical protein